MGAPICLFVYKRYEHTRKTIESLKKVKGIENSMLFIFSDGPKNKSDDEDVKKVRDYINSIDGFKSIEIVESEKNKGLAKSVIEGVGKLINKYGKLIVIEDDLEFSCDFLEYMNSALELYEDNQDVWSISGYSANIGITSNYKEDVYFIKRGCSWGWATWKDRWNSIDWECKDYYNFRKNRDSVKSFNQTGNDMIYMLDLQMNGEIDSWAIRWCYEQWKQQKYTVYPVRSKVSNNGSDSSGTHSGCTNKFDVIIDNCMNKIQLPNNIIKNKEIEYKFRKFYSNGIKIYISRLSRKMGIYKFAKKKYTLVKSRMIRKNL